MKYLKNLMFLFIVLSVVVAIGLSMNSVQAEPCGCSDDDLFAQAIVQPDMTASGGDVDLPPITMDIEPERKQSEPQPMPAQPTTGGKSSSQPLVVEIQDTPTGCGEPPPRRGVKGIDVAEKDPRFISMAEKFDPKSNEYDQCLNLFAFVITTSEKIQKAMAEGNDDEVKVWRSSIYEAIGYLRDLGVDPEPLKPEIEAAGCEILTNEVLAAGDAQAGCKNCGRQEEKIRGVRIPLPDLDEKTMKGEYNPRVVRVFEKSSLDCDDVDVALQLLSYIVEAPEGYAKAMEAGNTEEMQLWKNAVSHVIKKFRYLVDLSEFTSDIAEFDRMAGTNYIALLS
ncbi:MAG: hypothetical protein DRH70_06680, partial [Candidatus Coatesbacteria bacterium]